MANSPLPALERAPSVTAAPLPRHRAEGPWVAARGRPLPEPQCPWGHKVDLGSCLQDMAMGVQGGRSAVVLGARKARER